MTGAIPEGFEPFDVPDDFVQLAGPLFAKPEPEGLRMGLLLERRHGNPMGIAHGGLLMTLADMVCGVGSGYATGIRWPHPTISLNCDFVRGAKLGNWVEGRAVVTRKTINFCFTRTELVCAGETVLSAAGIFRIPPLDKVPPERRPVRAG